MQFAAERYLQFERAKVSLEIKSHLYSKIAPEGYGWVSTMGSGSTKTDVLSRSGGQMAAMSEPFLELRKMEKATSRQ